MALTKIGKEGITGVSNSANATFLTATSAEGVTLAGTLAVTGVHTVGNNAINTSEGGAVTQNLVQGLAKASCLFDQTEPGIDASFNTASLTDTAAGKGIVNWTNNMGGALTYSCTIGTPNGNDTHPYLSVVSANRNHVTQTTSAFPFRCGYAGFENASATNPYGSMFDPNGALVVAHGDLA